MGAPMVWSPPTEPWFPPSALLPTLESTTPWEATPRLLEATTMASVRLRLSPRLMLMLTTTVESMAPTVESMAPTVESMAPTVECTETTESMEPMESPPTDTLFPLLATPPATLATTTPDTLEPSEDTTAKHQIYNVRQSQWLNPLPQYLVVTINNET